MGRSKPRTNKRPPPKPAKSVPNPSPVPALNSKSRLTPLNNGPPNPSTFNLSSYVPPPSPPISLDPNDPSYATALHRWSTSTLGQMANLTQSQISAIAGAVAGVSQAGGFLSNPTMEGDVGKANHESVSAAALDAIIDGLPGSIPGITRNSVGRNGVVNNGNGRSAVASDGGNSNIPIDLPGSLAALFEAKLTLDREKAKLVKMQMELKGYRDGVAAVHGNLNGGTNGVVGKGTVVGNGKGKEVALEEDLGECTCGRNRHSHSSSAESGYNSEDDYYYSSGDDICDCGNSTCQHEASWDCEHDFEDDEEINGEEGGSHHHHDHDHHHHHHHHEEESIEDGHQLQHHYYQREHVHENVIENKQTQNHTSTFDLANPQNVPLSPAPHLQPIPYPIEADYPFPYSPNGVTANGNDLDPSLNMTYAEAFEAYQDTRDLAAKGLDEIGGIFKAAGWEGYGGNPTGTINIGKGDEGRRPLIDDPERLDEAVRELFNWIKAVVWTIEQAAIVAGRRSWQAQETR